MGFSHPIWTSCFWFQFNHFHRIHSCWKCFWQVMVDILGFHRRVRKWVSDSQWVCCTSSRTQVRCRLLCKLSWATISYYLEWLTLKSRFYLASGGAVGVFATIYAFRTVHSFTGLIRALYFALHRFTCRCAWRVVRAFTDRFAHRRFTYRVTDC